MPKLPKLLSTVILANLLILNTYFYTEWGNYGLLISTYCSAAFSTEPFSTDLLDRLICMKQKCHTTFLGKTQAYNMQHEYQKAETSALC